MIENKICEYVKCSAGKGVVSKQDCLKCALEGQNTCGYDFSLLKTLMQNSKRTGIHVTDLTGCLRKAFYDKTIAKPEYVHDTLYRFIGNAMHSYLENSESESVAEVGVEAHGIVGRMDVFRDGIIIDHKTTRWCTPSKLPYGSHEQQVNVYAEMMRQNGHEVKAAFIQYIDMSGPTKCRTCKAVYEPDKFGRLECPKCHRSNPEAHTGAVLVPVPLAPRAEVQQFIAERRDVLLKALETGKRPVAEPSFLCEYCPFVSECKSE